MLRTPRRVLAVTAAGLAVSACVALNFAEPDEASPAAREAYPTGPSIAPVASSDEPLGASQIEDAVSASLPFLLREGRAWMDGTAWVQDGTGCVSCHQVPFALWAQGAGKELPDSEDSANADAWAELGVDAAAHALRDDNGRPGIFAPLLLTAGGLSQADRRDILDQLVERQRRDGRWRARGQFPAQRRSIDETDAVITMWNLLAIGGDSSTDLTASGDRAVAWLATQDTPWTERSTEWLIARSLLDERDGDGDQRAGLVGEVLARQNEDGGWGFLAGDPSDAMTTGQALFGLAGLGHSTAADARDRGVSYLLTRQNEDGSWTVPSRLLSDEPSARNDYVYDVWGTSWAVIGLSATER